MVNVETPCIVLSTLNYPLISFWYHSKDSSGFTNSLHLDVFSQGQWNMDAIAPKSATTNTWNLEAVDLSPWAGQKIKARFRVNNNNGNEGHDIAIDDFRVVDNPCPIPFGLFESNITTSGVTLAWRDIPDANSYKLQGRRLGIINWLSLGINDTTFSTNNLLPGVTYEWRVKSLCTGGSSLFSAIDSFTTATSLLKKTGIREVSNSNLAVFPNPNEGKFKIFCDDFKIGNTYELRIFNSSGIEWMEQWSVFKERGVTVSRKLPPDVYLVVLKTENKTYRSKVFVFVFE